MTDTPAHARRRLHPLPAAALLLLTLSSAGCEGIGYVANAIAGGDEMVDVKAQYLGLQNKTTAVLVTMDDRVLLEFRHADERLCQAVSQQIKTNVPGAKVVSPADILKFQHDQPRLAAIPYGELLKQFKADRLLLVDVSEYRTHDPGNAQQWQGVVTAGISVAAADADDPDNLVFSTQAHIEYPKDQETGMLDSDSATIETAIRLALALQTSWLFYDHQEPAK
jgi:hypothetical protein